jgi:hypothetical protein
MVELAFDFAWDLRRGGIWYGKLVNHMIIIT